MCAVVARSSRLSRESAWRQCCAFGLAILTWLEACEVPKLSRIDVLAALQPLSVYRSSRKWSATKGTLDQSGRCCSMACTASKSRQVCTAVAGALCHSHKHMSAGLEMLLKCRSAFISTNSHHPKFAHADCCRLWLGW